MDPLVYKHDALGALIDVLKKHNPDIITIQESHTDDGANQAAIIAKELGLEFVANDVYDESHLEPGQGLSQAVISRFPIKNHSFLMFYNPHLETLSPTGERWLSHDKGVTTCLVDLGNGITMNVKTSHSFPYRRFHIEPFDEKLIPLRADMAEKLKPDSDIYLYKGDLNYNEYSVEPLLPDLIKDGIKEVILSEPTTPKGRKYDHVIYKGIRHINSVVINDTLTDHFPIYSEFDIQA